jgi:Icc-related predicted phosphoesterase
MRIVAISDTHTHHGELVVPDGDVLVHAGDFTNIGERPDVVDFNAWIGRQPHRHKVVIAGNHDWCFERTPEAARALLTNAVYLQDSGVEIEGVRFWGSPWQPWFYSWAFNLIAPEALRAKWDLIPANTDVLITHGPPLGHGDETLNGDPAGCVELLAVVEQIGPRAHIFGHIHEGYGVTTNGQTRFINASSCTVDYEPINAPAVFDL